MTATNTVKTDPTKNIDFNVIPQSPHVIAFRVWTRPNSTSPWTKVDEGSSEGDHHKDIGIVPSGGGISYWLGIGGNQKTEYRVLAALGQDGKLLSDGTFTETGMTNDEGFAVAEREISIA